MPKRTLSFSIEGLCQCTVDIPQEVIDQYDRECEKDNPDGRMLDRLLEPYINYDDVLNQLDDPEEIEMYAR